MLGSSRHTTGRCHRRAFRQPAGSRVQPAQTKYAGYIERQQDEIERLRASENIALPENLDYTTIPGLSKEIQHKLGQARPETLGQASRIPGVTPAAVSLLMIHLKKRNAGQQLEQSA